MIGVIITASVLAVVVFLIGYYLGKGRAIDKEQLSTTLKVISSEALKSNNESFLQLARENFEKTQITSRSELDKKHLAFEALIQPIHVAMTRFDEKIALLEKSRIGAYEGITQQIKFLMDSQQHLRQETSNLVKALRTPHVRGRWGEIQLKRVVELAGMTSYCDFFEQQSQSAQDEGRLRPDMIVRLPGGKNIVVDAKAPLVSYLEAIEAPTETVKLEKLKSHAQIIRNHIIQLSRKSYWDQFSESPEFVLLFLPGEMFFSAALEQDPSLIEYGVEQRVIVATPTTLISLLRAAAFGWKQEKIAENAQKIALLGKEMHKRVGDLSQHLGRVGKNLGQAVESYNQVLGTFETRVLVTARKFKELEGLSSAETELPELPTIDSSPRAPL